MRTKRSCRKRDTQGFEILDARRLLSSSLVGGVLTITGTNGDDKIDVARVGGNVVVDEHKGLTASFPAAAIGKIVAKLNDGNDKLTIDDTVTAPTSLFGGAGNDSIKGGSGNDSIFGGAGNDNLNGSIGNDVVNGEDGNDKLFGGAGKDALNGGKGNDIMDGGIGDDFVAGGLGSDTVSYATRSTPVTAHLHTDYKNFPLQVTGGGGVAGENDSYVGVENLVGGTAGDTLSYVAASEPVNKSFTQPISLDGRKGNDTLSAAGVGFGGSANADKYSIVSEIGGDGNDLIYHDNNVSTRLFGGNGNDDMETLSLGAAPPILADGGAGNDRWGEANSFGGTYTLDMSHGIETLFALNSSTGHVIIKGNNSKNFIRFSGGGATANIDAMGGDDHVVIGSDPDGEFPSATTVLGGAGNDLIEDQSSGPGGVSNDKFDGGSGNDILRGGAGNDVLVGGAGNDKLFGQAGNDTLVANDGEKDSLDGGAGTDKAKKDAIDNVLNVEVFI